MVKSILVNDNVHKLIVDKQYILFNADVRVGLSELAEKVIMTYLDEYIDKLLKKEEGK